MPLQKRQRNPVLYSRPGCLRQLLCYSPQKIAEYHVIDYMDQADHFREYSTAT